jgi:hypothetical protein
MRRRSWIILLLPLVGCTRQAEPTPPKLDHLG